MADSKLTAYAEGGPAAAQDYEAAKSDVGSIRQQALGDAANRSGAAYAPSEFRAQQATMIGAPLDSAITGLGRMSGAAGAYSGAMQSAQSAYLGDVSASHGLVQDALRGAATQDYAKALNDVTSFVSKQQAAQDRQEAQREKLVKKNDARNKDFNESAKKFAIQDATANKEMDGATLDVLNDAAKFSSLEEALAVINRNRNETGVIEYLDKEGNALPVNENLLNYYLQQAYSNQQDNSAAVLTGEDAAAFKKLYGG